MALGQAAGVAAALSVNTGMAVQYLDIEKIQDRLLDQGSSLIWFKDVSVDSPDFKMVQKMALKGYISGWEARLDEGATQSERTSFRRLSGIDVPGDLQTRRDILYFIYNRL